MAWLESSCPSSETGAPAGRWCNLPHPAQMAMAQGWAWPCPREAPAHGSGEGESKQCTVGRGKTRPAAQGGNGCESEGKAEHGAGTDAGHEEGVGLMRGGKGIKETESCDGLGMTG